MSKKNYYAVKVGRKIGIFKTWGECQCQVSEYPNAKFKGFATLTEAKAYMGNEVIKKNKNCKEKKTKKETYRFDSKKFSSETKGYYVVRKGNEIGIFNTWSECEEKVKGYSGADYKKVIGKTQALKYLEEGNIKIVKEKIKVKKDSKKKDKVGYDVEPIKSIASVKSSKIYIDPRNIKEKIECIVFIDGSYDKRTKTYGSGVVMMKNDLSEYDVFYEAGYDEWEQWNIVGELESAKLALRKADEMGFKSIVIYHDLKNIALWATGEWKAKTRYTQGYVKFVEAYSKKLDIYFVKVKAHSTESIYNDLADEAAKNAIKRHHSVSKNIE